MTLHLRNAVTSLMKQAGDSESYRYAHDDRSARDEMACLPPKLAGSVYYEPVGPEKSPHAK